MLVRSYVNRLLYRRTKDFLSVLAIGDDGIVVNGNLATTKSGLVDLRSLLDFIAEDYQVRASKELENSQLLAVGIGVSVDGLVYARTEHLV